MDISDKLKDAYSTAKLLIKEYIFKKPSLEYKFIERPEKHELEVIFINKRTGNELHVPHLIVVYITNEQRIKFEEAKKSLRERYY